MTFKNLDFSTFHAFIALIFNCHILELLVARMELKFMGLRESRVGSEMTWPEGPRPCKLPGIEMLSALWQACGTVGLHVECLNKGVLLASRVLCTLSRLLQPFPLFSLFYSSSYSDACNRQLFGVVEMGWKLGRWHFCAGAGRGTVASKRIFYLNPKGFFILSLTDPKLSCNFAVTFAILQNEIRRLPSSWQRKRCTNSNSGPYYDWGCVLCIYPSHLVFLFAAHIISNW